MSQAATLNPQMASAPRVGSAPPPPTAGSQMMASAPKPQSQAQSMAAMSEGGRVKKAGKPGKAAPPPRRK